MRRVYNGSPLGVFKNANNAKRKSQVLGWKFEVCHNEILSDSMEVRTMLQGSTCSSFRNANITVGFYDSKVGTASANTSSENLVGLQCILILLNRLLVYSLIR
jgi:hypothetical protein